LLNRLVPRIGHPHRRQLASPQKLRQAHRIAAVRLHAIARLLRNERRCNNNAVVAKAHDLPIQPISCRPSLVAKRQPPMAAGKLPYQLRCRRRAVLDLANKPDFTPPTAFRNRHRIA